MVVLVSSSFDISSGDSGAYQPADLLPVQQHNNGTLSKRFPCPQYINVPVQHSTTSWSDVFQIIFSQTHQ
jgi:hypothetical protein